MSGSWTDAVSPRAEDESARGRPDRAAATSAPGRAGTGTGLPAVLRRVGWRVPTSVAAGLLVAAGFAPLGWWPLTVLGVGLLTLAVQGGDVVRDRRRFGLGYLFGLVFLGLTIGWVQAIAWPLAVALVAFEAVFFGLLGVLVGRLVRVPGWPLWAASAWVVVEWVYSTVPFDGFGWGRLGYTMVDAPLAGLYPVLGLTGVSLVTALAGQAVAWSLPRLRGLLRDRRTAASGTRSRRGIAMVLVAAVVVGLAGQLLRGWQPEPAAGSGSVTVGLVQGNVDGVGVAALGRARTVTNNHLSETITLMAKARTGQVAEPDFVLWPENSTDIDPTVDPITERTVQLSSLIADRPILVGAVLQGPGSEERQTAGLWWDPVQGELGRVEKRNLVPFGEYIPFRSVLLPLVPMLQLVGSQGIPGTGDGVMEVPLPDGRQLGIGTIICFEVAYDDTMAETIRGGTQLLVVQSNQATYGGTVEVPQQFAMTRVRAMETRREIAVATTSSASGFIDRDGTVLWQTAEFTADSHSQTMPLRSVITPAVRLGPAVSVLAGLLVLGGLTAGVVGDWRRRSRPQPG